MNVPNLLTVLRFLLVPIFGYFLYSEHYSEAILMFVISGFTDVLDGYIARKLNMVTAFGEFADPLADKLVQATAICMLTLNHIIPIFVIVIVFIKEILMGWGAYILYRRQKIVVSANWYGKLATVIFYIAICLALIEKISGIPFVLYFSVVHMIFAMGTITTVYALFMYYLNFKRIEKQS